MKQIQSLVKTLQLEKPIILQKEYRGTPYYLILMGAYFLLFFLNWCGIFYPLMILLSGFIAPLMCQSNKVEIVCYWPLVSFLLWIRTFCLTFSFLDSALLICLWHPNIKWGLKIYNYVRQYLKKKYVTYEDYGFAVILRPFL